MPQPTFRLDTSNLSLAMKEWREATRKDSRDAVNHAALNVAIRAIKYTPKTDKEKFKQYFYNGNIGFKLITIRYQKLGAITGLSREAMQAAGKAFFSKIARSIAYIKAGWIQPLIDLGGSARKGPSPAGHAAKSRGIKATEENLQAVLTNESTGSGVVGLDALQLAIDEAADDISNYARAKMGLTARRLSGKK